MKMFMVTQLLKAFSIHVAGLAEINGTPIIDFSIFENWVRLEPGCGLYNLIAAFSESDTNAKMALFTSCCFVRGSASAP